MRVRPARKIPDGYCMSTSFRLYLFYPMNTNGFPRFRVKLADILFQDGEDNVRIHYLQRLDGPESWQNVLELHLEGGRSWGDEIDLLYRHKTCSELFVHISGYGYWGDAEYYRSVDDGVTWQPTHYKRSPDPILFNEERLEQV